MKGHIRIKDKVYFEPDGLEKPSKRFFHRWGTLMNGRQGKVLREQNYRKVLEKDRASRQLIEVRNKWVKYYTLDCFHIWIKAKSGYQVRKNAKNNQPCEAEVTDKALITKLL